MRHYQYLIIGGGMAADAAAQGIREVDSHGSIGLISADSDPPYNRPPLTKGLWKGEPLESVWRESAGPGVEYHLGRRVDGLNPNAKRVADDRGEVYSFDKLLLATGGTPRRLDFGGDDVIYFRTLSDYRRLRGLVAGGQRFAVIGGSFIGSELAAALTLNHKEVTLIFPGRGICHRLFPPELSDFLNDYYRQKGVELWNGETLAAIEPKSEQFLVRTQSGRQTVVDGVIAGLGIVPNVDLARAAGLQTEDGIIVDDRLRTSHPDIYAAGDVACFFNPALGKRLRVEHEDNANTMGRLAGRNMAGQSERYEHLPFFYSDLFDHGYEAVGELDPHLETLIDWKEPFREGVVYYQQEGRVRGVLLWNILGQVDAARELISAHRTFQAAELKSRLPQAA